MDKACFWGDACKDAEPVVIVRLGTITTFHFSDGNAPSKPFLHMDFGPIQCLKLARNNIIKHRGQQAASKGLLTPQPPLFITCCILVGTLVVIPTRCARCVKVPGHGKFGIFRSYAVALILAFWEALISTQNTNSVPFPSKLVLLKLVHLAIFVSCEPGQSFRGKLHRLLGRHAGECDGDGGPKNQSRWPRRAFPWCLSPAPPSA